MYCARCISGMKKICYTDSKLNNCGILEYFFFEQKTAYELRISDWSSDVCSSDLPRISVTPIRVVIARHPVMAAVPLAIAAPVIAAVAPPVAIPAVLPAVIVPPVDPIVIVAVVAPVDPAVAVAIVAPVATVDAIVEIGRASCRGRGCQYC